MDRKNDKILNANDKKQERKNIIKEIIIYFSIILSIILIRTFVITPIRVSGPSMNDTLKNGEIVLLKKADKNYKRFDIVIFNYNKEKLIKRVIGLPNEKIEYKNNILYINDEKTADYITIGTNDFGPIQLEDNEYFVMGDNRGISLDSRKIGPVSKNEILGSTDFCIFPISRFGFFK